MIIGKVVGSVVATRKNECLTGSKFLIVDSAKEIGFNGTGRIVAVDNVGAGVGEIVLVTMGSAARGCLEHPNTPVDAVIVGIVDDASKITL